jgi:4-alpha-glucanotransferase
MNFPRASGILLHPTSLPGPFGIGDLGREAYQFANFLVGAGQSLWQMLPVGPAGFGNLPYQTVSVFAGNPLLISLETLTNEGLLESRDLRATPTFPEDTVDFEAVISFKSSFLKKSYKTFESRATDAERQEFETFRQQNASWLPTYSLFMALREAHHLAVWNTWEPDIRDRRPQAIQHWGQKLADEIRNHQYQQYQFFKQWGQLQKYCHERGIRLVGDMPIFVALDSAEVWSHPEMFYLDEKGQPTVVAGVPPDYFSKTGQLWGNPLYRWDVMAKDNYGWWIERFRAITRMFDIVRLDHFRGFEKYWEVPGTATTAIKGRWVSGPGAKFFEVVHQVLGELPIIAEDLGMITPEVHALRDLLKFPGMRVLQFAFSGDPKNTHLPHNYPRNCVVYTGTHDNTTTVGWYRGEDIGNTTESKVERERDRKMALKYLGTDGREINWDFIRLSLMSVADTAIIPLQDILGLGGQARMNIPGTTKDNWRWRFRPDMLSDEARERLREMTGLYGRRP